MLGRAVVAHCEAQGDEVSAHERSSLDITDAESVRETFERERPETVINCAAWTDVDGCELDPLRAESANANGPANLAEACRSVGASLVAVSTDYVFDGRRAGFYTQRDDPNPESIYAVAKLRGERLAQIACARTIVVRSGWIFGEGGRNFLSRIIELARRGERLSVIHDAYGTPTYAVDLAARLRRLAELDLPGVYHVVNGGEGASFKDFTLAALDLAGVAPPELVEVSMDDLDRPAPRPRNSRLRCLVSEAIGLPPLRQWQDALSLFAASEMLRPRG
jgi:dTDP-4-dehydrorhamnose reductase